MLKKFLGITLMLVLAVPAVSNAMDMTGKYGLGYFNSDTPVGGRLWLNAKMGIDLGVGLSMEDQGEDTYSDMYLGVGFNYVIFDTPRANFMVRPGLLYGSLDARPYGIMSESKWTMMGFSLMPVAEVFFGDHFSLSAGHGFELEMVSYPDEAEFGALAGESRTNIRTIDGGISHLGFHFYFK